MRVSAFSILLHPHAKSARFLANDDYIELIDWSAVARTARVEDEIDLTSSLHGEAFEYYPDVIGGVRGLLISAL